MTKKQLRASTAQNFHLDKRAHEIAAAVTGDEDELLDTHQVAALLGVSTQWVEGARTRGTGPKHVRLSPRCIRYTRGNVRAWLQARMRASTRRAA